MLKNILVDDSELRRSAKKVQNDNAASFSATSNSEPRRTILAVCSLKVQFLHPRVWDIWVLPWPPEFGIFGCFLDPIKDHVVLLSASVTFLCKGQNILNTLNRTIAFPGEDRCGEYFVIQLVCELQLSRQYNTPQRYGGLIALSWKIYRFRKVCSVCHYEIVNTVNKRNRARHI